MVDQGQEDPTMLMRSAAPRPAVELVPTWVTFCVGAGMVFPVTLVVRGIGFRGHLGSLVVLALAALWSIRSTVPAAAGLGTLCWAFTTGFIVNSFGTLTFGRQDLVLLAVCLGAPLAVCAWSRSTLGSSFRRRRLAGRRPDFHHVPRRSDPPWPTSSSSS
ncbi:hypothetical protein [Actinopolymorpha pittospori]